MNGQHVGHCERLKIGSLVAFLSCLPFDAFIALMFIFQEAAFQNYCMLTENGQGLERIRKKNKDNIEK